MTITEFLLARITEDGANYMNWSLFQIRDGIPGSYAMPERIKAECEAKRRIVKLAEWTTDPTAEMCYDNAIRLLAAVYADHPDYDDAWSV